MAPLNVLLDTASTSGRASYLQFNGSGKVPDSTTDIVVCLRELFYSIVKQNSSLDLYDFQATRHFINAVVEKSLLSTKATLTLIHVDDSYEDKRLVFLKPTKGREPQRKDASFDYPVGFEYNGVRAFRELSKRFPERVRVLELEDEISPVRKLARVLAGASGIEFPVDTTLALAASFEFLNFYGVCSAYKMVLLPSETDYNPCGVILNASSVFRFTHSTTGDSAKTFLFSSTADPQMLAQLASALGNKRQVQLIDIAKYHHMIAESNGLYNTFSKQKGAEAGGKRCFNKPFCFREDCIFSHERKVRVPIWDKGSKSSLESILVAYSKSEPSLQNFWKRKLFNAVLQDIRQNQVSNLERCGLDVSSVLRYYDASVPCADLVGTCFIVEAGDGRPKFMSQETWSDSNPFFAQGALKAEPDVATDAQAVAIIACRAVMLAKRCDAADLVGKYSELVQAFMYRVAALNGKLQVLTEALDMDPICARTLPIIRPFLPTADPGYDDPDYDPNYDSEHQTGAVATEGIILVEENDVLDSWDD